MEYTVALTMEDKKKYAIGTLNLNAALDWFFSHPKHSKI
jgi:hypothetical protein